MFAPVPSLEAPRVATSSGNAANTAVWAEGSASAAPLRSRWTGKWQPTWGPGVGVLAALASHTARRARRSPGGPSGPAVREQKRAKKAERERRLEKFRSPYVPNRHEPPPLTARGAPKTGAWENGTPETEQMRQGQFTSPWTGQVYDRWSAEGRLQRNTDRQGGLARSRAYETPTQRQIATAVEERDSDHTPEWAKYYPGLAPVDKLPLTQRRTGAQVQTFDRHAYRAGNFGDIFKQLLVHTIVELKDLYSVLQDQDLTYMPPEVKGWMETVQMLNFSEDMEFEETGEGPTWLGWGCGLDNQAAGTSVESHIPWEQLHVASVACHMQSVAKHLIGADKAPKGIQWLPSTTMVALRLLRKQDPVTIWEDSRRAFAPLFNFVRNWSSKVQPHIELIFKDGLKHCHRRWVQHKPGSISEVYGKYNGQRGVVFIDPDYTRGGEAERCKTLIVDLWKHWRSATVVITYPIGPQYEKKARDSWRRHRGALTPGVGVATKGATNGALLAHRDRREREATRTERGSWPYEQGA
eukprot:g23162.t1